MGAQGLAPSTLQDGAAAAAEDAEGTPEEDETTRAFRAAAEALREQREEAAMSVEERISKCDNIYAQTRAYLVLC